ncbi:MAG: recombinase family protein, partial [Alistipes sp.]|nr:recombinase family protein [Alistipes sp.]
MYQYGYQAPKQRKVAVYARVSTEHEAQLSALENQKDWYKPIIAQHPEWDIVRMYTDEGITGTSAQKRPQFMKMIEDAGDGEFDLILTREVARFARNTVDTLQYTRSLKAKGVEVFFINDNIKTFDGDGELRLTIMATLAQDESRKTSIRVKCGQQTSMDNGVFYGNGNILGYDRVGKDMVINPEQAKTVRMIYDWYLDGVGIRAIKFRLEQAGRLTAMGKSNWHESNISKILQNSFYCGIITYHKEYTPDFLEQKKIRNFGEIELTKTRGTHEPIITEEEFERVQEMMAKRRKELPNTGAGKRRQIGEKQPGDVWTELLICECGHKFNRKVWHRVEDDVQYGYQCYSSIRTGTVTTRLRKGLPIDDVCKTPMIAGWKLQMMVKNIFREYLHNTAEVLALAEAMLERHIDDEEPQTDNNRLIEQKQEEAEKLNKRLHSLIEMRADGEITRDIFKAKKQEIEDRLLAIQNELSQLQPQEEAIDDATHDEKIKILKFYLEQSVNPDAMDNIPEDVIRAFIVKVVVHENSFDWYLRFSPDKPPKSLCIDGKRKTTAKVSSLCSPQHRLLLTKVGKSNFVKVQEFSIDLGQAKAYLYAYSTRHRIHKWNDLHI